MKKIPHNKGIGLIEVLIAATIITTGILGIMAAYTVYIKYAFANSGNVQAAYLMEEGLEAMTLLRDKSWSGNIAPLSTTTTYYIAFSSGTWKATTTPQYVDSLFLRKITLSDVQRDGSGKIVTSSGTYDADSRFVTVTIDYYQGHATTTRTMSTYITNFNQD